MGDLVDDVPGRDVGAGSRHREEHQGLDELVELRSRGRFAGSRADRGGGDGFGGLPDDRERGLAMGFGGVAEGDLPEVGPSVLDLFAVAADDRGQECHEHAKVSMTQDRYLGRRLTDRQTADVLEAVWEVPREERSPKRVPGKQ